MPKTCTIKVHFFYCRTDTGFGSRTHLVRSKKYVPMFQTNCVTMPSFR